MYSTCSGFHPILKLTENCFLIFQECIRYQNPHKAFTFKVHGYEAVVGPVKGVYGKESGINKAREHSLLTSDRPPFVTILSLGNLLFYF